MNRYSQVKNSKYLPFLAILLICISILAMTCKYKLQGCNYQWLYGSICATEFILFDIIAEVYSYKTVINMFCAQLIVRIIFLVIYGVAITLPSPNFIENESSYNLIFSMIKWIVLINPILCLIAWYINAKLFNKWRILLYGKYFWLRSFSASGFSEIVFIASLSFVSFLYHKNSNFTQYSILMCIVIFQRLLLTALLAYPASLIVNTLKIVEGTNIKEVNTTLRQLINYE